MHRRLRSWLWLLASLVLHGWLIGVRLDQRAQLAPAANETASELSFEALPVHAAAEPAPQPEAANIDLPPRPVNARRSHVANSVRQSAANTPVDAASHGSEPAALAASPESSDGAATATPGAGEGGGVAAGGGGDAPAPRGKGGPTELSVWLDLPQLEHHVIVRSPTALLGAIPGYRDLLRGSNIRPFMDLQRMRVRLSGLTADDLTLAAVHSGGEDSVKQAAERIAAMRRRVLDWRGSSELRATAWVDGSAIDRGLAVHGGAFLIGARTGLAKLLGEQAPGAQVDGYSQMRRRVMLLVTLRDAAHYLPALAACQLHSLRVSVSADLHMSVSAEYETTDHAARARACLESLPNHASELRYIRSLLARAETIAGNEYSQLNTGVTREDIEAFLDELCWSLRRVARA